MPYEVNQVIIFYVTSLSFVFCSQKYAECSFSSSTAHFNFKTKSQLKIQVDFKDRLEKKRKKNSETSKPHLKKPSMISHHLVVLIRHDSAELLWCVFRPSSNSNRSWTFHVESSLPLQKV